MTTAEGAIQFRYTLDAPAPADVLDAERFAQMAAWRTILRQLDLVGRDPARYDGYAYGNLSVRDGADPHRFYVTASQTGGDPSLARSHLVRVDRWNAERFELFATGVAPPSSESITHGILYDADPSIAWVMHVHARAIWRNAHRLDLPVTGANVSYGSPAMANAVSALLRQKRSRPIAFATLGHEDGVFVSGASADETGALLVRTLAAALGAMR
jgi:ribulose-5-phosphate 4-epimerase/fuculose-1-phosphate aldolase